MEKLKGKILDGNEEAAMSLVEYGNLAGKAHDFLKKKAGLLREAYENKKQMVNDIDSLRSLIFYGFDEETRKAYQKKIPRKDKGVADKWDKHRIAKAKAQRLLSRHVNTIIDWCFPPTKVSDKGIPIWSEDKGETGA